MKKKRGREKKKIRLTVNGVRYQLVVGGQFNGLLPSHTLSYTLRETLNLAGTKVGCDRGACGSCTVLMDGNPILSCMTLTIACNGRTITTIEGLEDPKTGQLDRLQQSFIDHTAFQCGFCTPGIILASKALLDTNPSPDEREVKNALSGHFCRCMSHYHVVDAVLAASRKERG
jgi:aerobic-type carbon monoxide dehydrogenase small subunit (CoxS/CutS family)